MNNTREEQPREGCSCGGVVPLEGSIRDAYLLSLDAGSFLPDAFLLWWLVLFIEQGPGPLPQILSEKGANNWPF